MLPTPFDTEASTILYVPDRIPDPREPGAAEEAARRLVAAGFRRLDEAEGAFEEVVARGDKEADAQIIELANLSIARIAYEKGLLSKAADYYQRVPRKSANFQRALYEMTPPPKHLALPVISRIKVVSGLNIAERRLPQDGRIQLSVGGRDLDLRFRPQDVADAAALRRQGKRARGAGTRQNGYRLQARYTFTNFIVGESTRLACAAARSAS